MLFYVKEGPKKKGKPPPFAEFEIIQLITAGQALERTKQGKTLEPAPK